ncbi:multicilin [Aulostomus maculatus]
MDRLRPGECGLYELHIKPGSLSTANRVELKMQRQSALFTAVCPNRMGPKGAAAASKDKVLAPRSSSPVTVYVELPCIIEQAFSTIAWDDLEDCASMVRRESDFIGSQVNESDADDQDFGDYGLDFLADSPATLESSLSPAELVPFQGCIIPPLTPQRFFSPEDSQVNSSTETDDPPSLDRALWKGISQCQGRVLGQSLEVNNQLHETLNQKKEEISSLQERNLHLRQLACRAKHLASVLEELMSVRDPSEREPVMPGAGKTASPCKRQRLDDGYETESSDSVEDMLRDLSTRCNAVLHSTEIQQDTETIQVYGSFSGLQTSICKDSGMKTDGAEDECVPCFRTSVREHCTIRTQVFPHGRAFTSSTQQGGYRFRWVPNHS